MTIRAGRFFRAGTHGQFKPGFYHHRDPNSAGDITYASSDKEGFGAVLTVTPAREVTYGGPGFYDDNDPRNDPDYYDEWRDNTEQWGPVPDDAEDYDPGPTQGELFKQEPGYASTLAGNIESRSRTLSLLGMAARHQARNFGPALASGSLTPDSFGLLKHIRKSETGKANQSVRWSGGSRNEPEGPSEEHGDMRPTTHEGRTMPIHEHHLAEDFPSAMIGAIPDSGDYHWEEGDLSEVDRILAQPQRFGLREFTKAEAKEGKQFVRDQWTNIKKKGKKSARMPRQLTRQQSLFERTEREKWGATYDHV